MRWVQLISLCWIITVSCSSEDAQFFFTDVPRPVTLPESTNHSLLTLVGEYGDRNQGLVFGRIRDVAVNEAGILAVVDRDGCQIWIVDTDTGNWKTLGGCGDGPGEFQRPKAAAFTGDTLVVYDEGRSALVKITLGGEEVSRFQVSLSELGALQISDLHVGARGLIVAGLDLFPNSEGADHLQIALFDGTTGTVDGRGLMAPPIARATREPMVRYGSLCGGTTNKHGEVVVAVDTWGPQLAVLRTSDLRPLLSVRIPVPWARADEYPGKPGFWAPIGPLPGVACGERFGVVGYRTERYVDGRLAEVLRAAMVVIDLDGKSTTVLGGDRPPDPGSMLLMTPAAATGNRFFFFTNSHFDYPVVREYRIAGLADIQ